jgi:GxxExxY protein
MDLKYKDITEKIIGAAMKVHATLGNGFQEVIYQRALAIEMSYSDLSFEREHNMKIFIAMKRLEKDVLIFLLKKQLWLN